MKWLPKIKMEVSGLNKSFYIHERKKEISAIKDLNFTLNAGELLALTGPSGIGKSTILKCIYRTYISNGGDMWYYGDEGKVNLANCSDHEMIWLRQHEIGYVTQFLHCLPRKSTLSTVAMPLLVKGVCQEEAEERAACCLEQFNVPQHLWEIAPHTFSGGEKQRVNLARGFINQPKMLLLDEPTASLDPETKEVVLKNIQKSKESGTAIIGIFHDLEIVERIADSTVSLKTVQLEERVN